MDYNEQLEEIISIIEDEAAANAEEVHCSITIAKRIMKANYRKADEVRKETWKKFWKLFMKSFGVEVDK